MKRITYVIKQGPSDLFSVNPGTGVVKTIRGLDYEKEMKHILIIGTLENDSDKPGANTTVIVHVEVINRVSYAHFMHYELCVLE